MTAAYLVDTHVLLWALNDPDRLPVGIAGVLRDPEAEAFFSPVCLWEVAIKHSLGKIDLAGHSPEDLLAVTLRSGFLPLEVTAQTCASSHRLPRRHKEGGEQPRSDRVDAGQPKADQRKRGRQAQARSSEAGFSPASEDPFARLIVWQAIQSGMPLLSADRTLEAYAEDGLQLVN